MKRFLALSDHFVVIISIALLVGCARPPAPVGQAPTSPGPAAQRANPASQHCVEQGGTLTIERNPGGGQYGVCTFSDNRQCEEWALLRGECPTGGIRAAGYATLAARYCGITAAVTRWSRAAAPLMSRARARCRAARRATRRHTTAGRAAGRVRLRSADSAPPPWCLRVLAVFVR